MPLIAESPKVTFLRVVNRTPNSLSLSWAVDQHTTSHHSPHYELMYRIKVCEKITVFAKFVCLLLHMGL